jgi:hypothetical protein
MNTISEIRHARLLEAIAESGSARRLAEAVGTSEAYISQLVNALPDSKTGTPKNIGDAFSRKVEAGLKKRRGWMDNADGVGSCFADLAPEQAEIVKEFVDRLRDGTLPPAQAETVLSVIKMSLGQPTEERRFSSRSEASPLSRRDLELPVKKF